MKKKLLVLFLATVMVIGAAISGTVAYLTSEDDYINVSTIGNVKIVQFEKQRNQDGSALVDFKQGQPLYPAYYEDNWDVAPTKDAEGVYWTGIIGAMDKLVYVENTGRSDAFVRTWIALECPDDMVLYEDILVNKNTDGIDWSEPVYAEIDEQRYAIICATYIDALAAGDTADYSLLQVAIAGDVQNVDVVGDKERNIKGIGDTYEILSFTEACQTRNMPEPTADDIANGIDTKAAKALDIAFGRDVPCLQERRD